MKLLLVDDRIDQLEAFILGVNDSTEVIVYSYEEDTYASILNQKRETSYDAVGIVSNNYRELQYRFIKNETPCQFNDSQSWDSFINFLTQFQSHIVDLMACKLFSSKKWQDIFSYIETKSGDSFLINVRGSIDDTGNPEQGGNWVMESDNIEIRNLYFSDLIQNYTGLLDSSSYNRYYGDYNNKYEDDDFMIVGSNYGYTILVKSLGRVWNVGYSNVQNGVWVINADTAKPISDIVSVYSNQFCYCAVDSVGRCYTWGVIGSGAFESGYARLVKLVDDRVIKDIVSITMTNSSFTALDVNGDVYSWGDPFSGGINPSYATQVRIGNADTGDFLSNIVKVYSTSNFNVARDQDGKLYTWGNTLDGGNNQSYATLILKDSISGEPLISTENITVNDDSMAVIVQGGDVYVWGEPQTGGITSLFATQLRIDNATTGQYLTDVVSIISDFNAFTALDENGNVFAWGYFAYGGINEGFATQVRIDNATTGDFLSGIVSIYYGGYAFTALNEDGNVFVWGSSIYGGINQEFATQLRINNATTGDFLSGIVSIISNTSAFTAVNEDGNVFVWGSPDVGGFNLDFATQVLIGTEPLNNITNITPNFFAFSVLAQNGNLYTWGAVNTGGSTIPSQIVYDKIIKSIIANNGSFLFIDEEKNLVIFGASLSGGLTGNILLPLEVVQKAPIVDQITYLSSNGSSVYIPSSASKQYITGFPIEGGLNFISASKILDNTSPIISNTAANCTIIDGNVYLWGSYLNLSVPTLVKLEDGTSLTDIVSISKTSTSFAFLSNSGNVYVIGSSTTGGINSTFATQLRINNATTGDFLSGIVSISTGNSGAFAALNGDGNVFVWGNLASGGINQTFATQVLVGSGDYPLDIVSISVGNNAFAGLNEDGNVFAWGNAGSGGINTGFATQVRINNATTGDFLSDIVSISRTNSAFAALSGDGNVYVWGVGTSGGISQNFATQVRINNATTGDFLSDILSIYSTSSAFAALNTDGNVYVWGGTTSGGINPFYATQVRINNATTGDFLSDIVSISRTNSAFAALNTDGNVYVWGGTTSGGINPFYATQVRIGSTVGDQVNATKVVGNASSFASIGSDGYVYVWGSQGTGGITNLYATQLRVASTDGTPLIASPLNKLVSNSNSFGIIGSELGSIIPDQLYVWGSTIFSGTNLFFATKINLFSYEVYVEPEVNQTSLDVVYKDYEFTVSQIMEKAQVSEDTTGIAVTYVKTTNGLWKYKTDSFWEDIPGEAISEESALPLLADSSLQFVPSSGYNGSTEFSFKAWSGLAPDESNLFDSTIPNLGLVSQNTVNVTVNDEPPSPEESSNSPLIVIIIFAVLLVVAVIFAFFAPSIINFFSGFKGVFNSKY